MARVIDVARVRASIGYDPISGKFWWLHSSRGSVKSGDEAGYICGLGYRMIKIGQEKHFASRLAWTLHTGTNPIAEIDHINGIRSDDRISNLREASRAQNCYNRDFEGVRYEADRDKWLARICYGGKTKNLGRFKTKEEALSVRRSAEIEVFGDFARARL